MTRTAYDALCARRDALLAEDLPQAQQRLVAIQDAGDPEGLESTAAVFDVQQLQAQIARLERTIADAVVLHDRAHDRIDLGAVVTLDFGDGAEQYRIDTHLGDGCLSPTSPIGVAVMGRVAGETVEVATPGGPVTVMIISVT